MNAAVPPDDPPVSGASLPTQPTTPVSNSQGKAGTSTASEKVETPKPVSPTTTETSTPPLSASATEPSTVASSSVSSSNIASDPSSTPQPAVATPTAPPAPEPEIVPDPVKPAESDAEKKSKDENVKPEHPSIAMTTAGGTDGGDSKFGIFIAILVMVVVLIWVGVGFLFFSGQQTPAENSPTAPVTDQ